MSKGGPRFYGYECPRCGAWHLTKAGAAAEERRGVTRLLTAEDLADRWQVPRSHVYRLARERRIPTVELGRYRRFRLDQIEAFELGADTVPIPANSGRGDRANGPPA